MNSLNASKGVNTSTLATVKKGTLTGFKATGRALTSVFGRPNTMAFALRGGALVGALAGGYSNPWLIPAAAVAGATAGLFLFCYTEKSDPGDSYGFGLRLLYSVLTLAGGAAISLAIGAATYGVWSRVSPEGIAHKAADKLKQEQAAQAAWAAEEKQPATIIGLPNGEKLAFKNISVAPKKVEGDDACEITWSDPDRKRINKALVLRPCADLYVPKK